MPKPKKQSDFLNSLNKVPPCIVRWHAIEMREGKAHLLNNNQLAKKSGLSKRMIQRVSAKSSWTGIRAEIVDKFLYGCNASLHDLAWYTKFLDEYADKGFPHVTDRRMRETVFKVMGWQQ